MVTTGVEDFDDEDTEQKTAVPEGKDDDEPRYELMWVEEPGMGMVLRVRRVTEAADPRLRW